MLKKLPKPPKQKNPKQPRRIPKKESSKEKNKFINFKLYIMTGENQI